ncbi:MAG: hypothetical protein LUO95_05280 [Methylococcaceae bacterium]|nr:hypothetical protein [Methylococcaceae bacterium]MDD1610014.1 hypothetical protein [Methylococcaceae bacterium]OYV18321.1 MAG: hypothetical protein CG439_1319 [Methylococcaceae bacterium NSP1-2]
MTNAVFYGQGYLFSKPVSAAEFERLFDVPIIDSQRILTDIKKPLKSI